MDTSIVTDIATDMLSSTGKDSIREDVKDSRRAIQTSGDQGDVGLDILGRRFAIFLGEGDRGGTNWTEGDGCWSICSSDVLLEVGGVAESA
jgi:hypothetical protein